MGYETVAVPVSILFGAISGLLGSLADSWLGATWQVMYQCTVCGKTIEKEVHCGQGAKQIRGFRFMTNDRVNALSSLVGGVIVLHIMASIDIALENEKSAANV